MTNKDTFDELANRDVVVFDNLHVMLSSGLQGEQALRNIIMDPQDGSAKKNFDQADVRYEMAV